jgi:hypothetical protein
MISSPKLKWLHLMISHGWAWLFVGKKTTPWTIVDLNKVMEHHSTQGKGMDSSQIIFDWN